MVGQGIINYLSENFLLLVVLTGIIYLFCLPHHVLRKERINLIIVIFICGFLSIVSFIFTHYAVSMPDVVNNILFFVISFGTPFIAYYYFLAISGFKRRWIFLALLGVNGAVLLSGIIGFDIAYKIESGVLKIGPLFYLSILLIVGFLVASLVYGIVKKSKDKIILSSFILAVAGATIAVVAASGDIGVIYLVAVVCSSFCYCYKYYVYDTVYQAQEIKKKQLALAISQIQPHFIFNALNSIYALMDLDILKAKKLLNEFSIYLRVNIDSLNSSEPIEFIRELHHIDCYVNIEKIRFNEKLNIVYNIEYNNFKIAPLTLQPLVENAIRHGICKKPKGGAVIVSTKRIDNFVEIRIEDNGVGFDVNKEIDTNVHTGFTNVKDRVEGLYKGKFEYSSEIGVGTKIKILLPLR